MRDIEFRGKDITTGSWVYGTYLKHQTYMPYPIGSSNNDREDYVHLILTSGFADWGMKRGVDCFSVHEESVGQYVGLKDKNGNKVFEGDILLYSNNYKSTVWYKNGAFVRSYGNSNVYLVYDSFMNNDCLCDYEVIGNIYENPELLVED